MEASPEKKEKVTLSARHPVYLLLKERGPKHGPYRMNQPSRDTYGVTWLSLSLLKRGKVEGGTLKALDLSRCSVSPGKLFLLLSFLPDSMEELKLGPSAVKAPALPLLCNFLGCVGTKSMGVPRVASLAFSRDSIGPEEAPAVFLSLPVFLTTLNLEGNHLGTVETHALASAIKSQKVLRFLEKLNLRGTGLDDDKVNILSSAFASVASPLPLKELSLSGLRVHQDSTVEQLFQKPECRQSVFPNLQSLVLSVSSFAVMKGLAGSIRSGVMTCLRELCLQWDSGCLGGRADTIASGLIGGVLSCDTLPHLRTLDMGQLSITGIDAKIVTASLHDKHSIFDQWKSLETVRLCIDMTHVMEALEEETTTDVLWSGQMKLDLTMRLHGNASSRSFLKKVASASNPLPCKSLDLILNYGGAMRGGVRQEVVEALTDALSVGRLCCLRSLEIESVEVPLHDLFDCIRMVDLPLLCNLRVVQTNLFTDRELKMLGQKVEKGGLCQLRKFDLSGCRNVGGEGLKVFCDGVCACAEGLPSLSIFDLSYMRVGEGALFLVGPIREGKLPSIEQIRLHDCGGFSDAFMHSLSDAVLDGRLMKLEGLDLSRNDVTASAAEVFCKTFFRLPALKMLDLFSTRAGKAAGVMAFVLSRGGMPSLETLDLRDSGLTDQGRQKLEEACGGERRRGLATQVQLFVGGN
uniref:Uncharacterized protein n=1 Tax=Chromera velia CCMP2878 TaxID=1169474 RepID=A0A0G4GVE2_9ALVE|eukprot:Cvel_5252.t1-p1 / transcript=Cvel_5252.t1 / gene=Cvel_5252 / organism=Chromera_velia_CCMP2878 / gene_product=hypothetical protein / transcript_product=hypothetical protein / location=Cvel_scaffold242:50901-52970(+) / protein_length=690 / sequence_SO=supercontig / SO=protein_coding / is_pseudo=false